MMADVKHDVVSILSGSDRDFVVRNDGSHVKVGSLKEKMVGLYLSASWCIPNFTPQLDKAYSQFSSEGHFEIIFISCDNDAKSFDDYFSKMPWPAIPFADSETRKNLISLFDVTAVPRIFLICLDGHVATDDGISVIRMWYDVDEYPITAETKKESETQEEEEEAMEHESLKSLLVLGSHPRDFVIADDGRKQGAFKPMEAKLEEMANGWPRKLKHSIHEDHDLVLTRDGTYICDGCSKAGLVWSYDCKECDYDLHPECALNAVCKKRRREEGETAPEGWICEEGVCI